MTFSPIDKTTSTLQSMKGRTLSLSLQWSNKMYLQQNYTYSNFSMYVEMHSCKDWKYSKDCCSNCLWVIRL